MPGTASPVDEYLKALARAPKLSEQVVFRTTQAGSSADIETAGPDWPPVINKILGEQGTARLYRHQAEALDLIRTGRHVVVATPTASGKTLIYNLAVLEQCVHTLGAKALYVFPLKALARDQMGTLKKMIGCFDRPRPTVAIYDGDTSQWHRKKIRQAPPNILMTNPEMMHLSLLAHHRKWASFWRDLNFIVIDEVHTYRGILGCHFAQVLRRLQRICNLYGAGPTYIFSSATIGNPDELVYQLSGLDVSVVTASGAPVGRRHVVFMNPDTSPAQTAIELLKAALPRGLRTIVYTQSRKMTELIAMWAADRAGKFRSRISAYRAGYLPAERRQIESRLASGDLLAVISTSALELGIDIGHLDLCILVGYPGSVVATRQRGGRVGRGGQDSALVIIGGDDALDQYVMQHPEEVLSRKPERAIVHPENPVILAMHMECAAAELPLDDNEKNLRPAAARAALVDLEKNGRLLREAGGSTFFANRGAPHRKINLRGGGDRFQIVDAVNRHRIGEIDAFRVYRETHPGAVYLHRGDSYIVDRLDERERNVIVSRQAVDYYTRVKSHKKTEIIQTEKIKDYDRICFSFGRIEVTDHVYGYEVLRVRDRMLLDQAPLEAPPQIFETQAMWLTLPQEIGSWLGKKPMDLLGGLHAVEHATISMFPLLVMADRNDIGGLATAYHDQTGTATIFVYDGFPGGVGLSRHAFRQHRGLIDLTLASLQNCPCEGGCPSCVQSPKCGNGNRPLDKSLAIRLLEWLKKKIGNDNSGIPGGRSAVSATDMSEGRETTETAVARAPIRHSGAFGVLDLETQLSAADVGGWQHAHRMKVSCGVLYDARQNRFLEFMADQVPELLRHLRKMDFIIGFNVKGFDYKVLSAYSQMDFGRLKTLDILEAVHRILGYRLSLNHLAAVTLNEPKKADGLQALKWWREGRLRELVDYCRHDVQLTRDLYLYGRRNGYLLFRDKTGRVLRIPVDW